MTYHFAPTRSKVEAMGDATTAPLDIPDVAYIAAYVAIAAVKHETGTLVRGRGAIAPIVNASAPHAVAAELRRQADEIESGVDDYIRDGASDQHRERCYEDKAIAKRLRARADQLDGGTG